MPIPMNTVTVGAAVTPTVIATGVDHYLHKKKVAKKPQAHISYHEGVALVRKFLATASTHSVEELQLFTSQWVPVPRWVKTEAAIIPPEKINEAADWLVKELGPEGIKRVGGENWWRWRKDPTLKAEWVEMRKDYNLRKKGGGATNRVMMFVHGGAYFFGSVDVHRYMLQRHARKLKARVFAPRYRLAPQFPFPCGLLDCLASYLYLLTVQDPSTIIVAGDSAGGGMLLAMMVLLRNQGLPLPAGAVLLSPWCDLTHSFPSVMGDASGDYVPNDGFHHRPSPSWPPVIEVEKKENVEPVTADQAEKAETSTRRSVCTFPPASGTVSITIDGELVEVSDQIQLYATNALVTHPMVTPILQPSLGGLPPMLVMTGGSEVLRDEQIYLAHKAANPAKYPPGDLYLKSIPNPEKEINKYPPTDVNLQVWDDCCHVAMTLSFTRPAKYMFRSVAQFSAWALAKAQDVEIPKVPVDERSIISTDTDDESGSPTNGEVPKPNYQNPEHDNPEFENRPPPKVDTESPERDPQAVSQAEPEHLTKILEDQIGAVGVPLPKFENHMLRQRVDRHGTIHPLGLESSFEALTMDPNEIGIVKSGPVKKWLAKRAKWDKRYSKELKIMKQRHYERLQQAAQAHDISPIGEGEIPPPAALINRWAVSKGKINTKNKKEAEAAGLVASGHEIGVELREEENIKKKRGKSLLAMRIWHIWGGRHDEKAVQGAKTT